LTVIFTVLGVIVKGTRVPAMGTAAVAPIVTGLSAESVPLRGAVLDALANFAAFFVLSASISCCSFINSRNETFSADPKLFPVL
jgi:hypothetical protein